MAEIPALHGDFRVQLIVTKLGADFYVAKIAHLHADAEFALPKVLQQARGLQRYS